MRSRFPKVQTSHDFNFEFHFFRTNGRPHNFRNLHFFALGGVNLKRQFFLQWRSSLFKFKTIHPITSYKELYLLINYLFMNEINTNPNTIILGLQVKKDTLA